MKAIILSAGQGSRLLPLTNDTPKCLLPVGSKTVLVWQIDALVRSGQIDEIIVVTGFMSEKVEKAVKSVPSGRVRVSTLFNPFYGVADNLASCWMARDLMEEDYLIINGDSLFDPSILPVVISASTAPINLTINRKAVFDSDDMKVTLDGSMVKAVGKTIGAQQTDAESIGLVYFKGMGGALFRNAVDDVMRDGSGLNAWYLQVINSLAQAGHVGAVDIEDRTWCEIDFPSDLEIAQKTVDSWRLLRNVI